MTTLFPSSGRYEDLPPRCLADRRDMLQAALRHVIPVELRVAIYAQSESVYLLSATTSICETGEPLTLPLDVTNERLGTSVLDLLLQCWTHPLAPPTGRLEDWPIFVASGAKTGKAFESKATYVSVKTANSALVIEACRRYPPCPVYVGRQTGITCDPAELGRIVKELVAALRFLDQHDVI